MELPPPTQPLRQLAITHRSGHATGAPDRRRPRRGRQHLGWGRPRLHHGPRRLGLARNHRGAAGAVRQGWPGYVKGQRCTKGNDECFTEGLVGSGYWVADQALPVEQNRAPSRPARAWVARASHDPARIDERLPRHASSTLPCMTAPPCMHHAVHFFPFLPSNLH